MECLKCNKKLRATKHKYDYSAHCGIQGVYLTKAKVYKCKACDESYYNLGLIDDINQEIANVLLTLNCLTRQHVSYIRKHIFNENYFQFGARLGAHPLYLKDIELLKRPLPIELSKQIQLMLFNKMQIKPTVKVS